MKKYIRTKDNRIFEIGNDYRAKNYYGFLFAPECKEFVDEENGGVKVEVIKQSDEIFDLIEVGDLVNINNINIFNYAKQTYTIDGKKRELKDIVTQIYTKQCNDYILVWDKEKGVRK